MLNGEIHLWLTPYDKVPERLLRNDYRSIMSATEMAQAGRFYFERDRWRYVVTRALVRLVLSRYAPVAPAQWEFATNPYGRPEIVNAEGRVLQLTFNISHTHSLIVLAITRSRAIGVDVENIHSRRAPIDIADRYFSPVEVAALKALPSSERDYRFFEYWIFKESYIKARGMGLSIPLDKFSFLLETDRVVSMRADRQVDEDAARWHFWQFRSAAEYLVAICAERSNVGPPEVTARELIPMLTERALALRFLRTSD